jgi:hypothetical protein
MGDGRLARSLLYLLVLLSLLSGCQMFQAERSVSVLVRDAETKQPIPTAEVYLCERLKGAEIAPCRSSALTQANGLARLRLDSAAENGIQLQAIAPGYQSEKLRIPANDLPKPDQAKTKEPGPTNFVLEVFAEPAFTVELMVPTGYRGLVKAQVVIQENEPSKPGQRCFRYPISSSGVVQITGPAILRRVAAEEYRARWMDGTLLPTRLDPEKVGFRWLKSEGQTQYFVIGTLNEYEELCRSLFPERMKASGSWEGGSRHGHKGRKSEEDD